MSGLNNHYITQRAKNISDIYIKQHGIEQEIIWPVGPCSLLKKKTKQIKYVSNKSCADAVKSII